MQFSGVLLEDVVTRFLVGASTAPRVSVQAEEVKGFLGVVAAGKVVLQHRAKGGNISGRVADRDVAVALLGAVSLHIPGSGLDVRSSNGAIGGGDGLVAHKEASKVVVLLELIHDRAECVLLGFSPFGSDLLNIGVESIEIEPDVD